MIFSNNPANRPNCWEPENRPIYWFPTIQPSADLRLKQVKPSNPSNRVKPGLKASNRRQTVSNRTPVSLAHRLPEKDKYESGFPCYFTLIRKMCTGWVQAISAEWVVTPMAVVQGSRCGGMPVGCPGPSNPSYTRKAGKHER
jgi:hypothetical protein